MDEVEMTLVTQEILDNNPSLVESGVAVGDEVPTANVIFPEVSVDDADAEEDADEDDDSAEAQV